MSENTPDPVDSEPKRSLDDPKYRIPGTNLINFSHWSRENVPKPDHQYQIGDIVVLMRTVEITGLTRDCDGTALYSIEIGGQVQHGWSEDHLRAATEEEKRNH